MRRRKPNAVEVQGFPFTRSSWEEILAEVDMVIRSSTSGHFIAVTNTESMYHALRIPTHGHFVRTADMSLCDGIGVTLVGLSNGVRIPRRNGPVLQLACCRYGESRGWRHFFYGGAEGVSDRLVSRLTAMYPGLICAGTYTPPFRELSPEEDANVVTLINAARPDIIWVGLGLLKQERWIAEHLGRIEAPWMIGVGAAFDYHAGVVPYAPRWMRLVGLEWLFRLVVQPRLRARRYWWSLVFVAQGIAGAMRTRLRRRR